MTSQINVSKLNVYADVGPQPSQLAVTKVTVYALVSLLPVVRRKVGVSTRIEHFVRPT